MAEKEEIGRRVAEAIRRLEDLGKGLEGLSADIWQAIDHEDEERLASGVRFKQQYNARRRELGGAADRMLALLKAFPDSGPGRGAAVEPAPGMQAAESETEPPEPVAAASVVEAGAPPLLRDLDQKAPFGFILSGQTFTSASAWPLFYEALLQEFYGRDPAKLSRLADEPGGFTYRGRPLFARVPDRLEDPLPVTDAIFAEADLDPEVIIQVIRSLIAELGYPLESFKILLKEKKRGTVETLSIAA
jgi:hypothetical protein